jgi:hypothetical protein
MRENEQNPSEEFIQTFRWQLSEVDELTVLILNGHLEVEKYLEEVVDLIFFRPEQLQGLRLSFYAKVQIARACCPNPDSVDWEIIKCLGELRNSIAHRKTGEMRGARLKKLRQTMLGWGGDDFRKEIRVADDKEVVVQASALCSAFLIYLEESTRKVREVIAKSLHVPEPPVRQE